MPCAQMYHANAWCTPYAAPLVGAKLVLPGRRWMAPASAELIADEGVTFAARRADHLGGVPTTSTRPADARTSLWNAWPSAARPPRGPDRPHREPAGGQVARSGA